MRRMEAKSRGTSDGASAPSLVLCCLFLPPCSRPPRPPTTSTASEHAHALERQQRRAPRLVAGTQDGGGEQVHEGRRISVVSHALLAASALFHVARRTVRPRPPLRPSPRPQD